MSDAPDLAGFRAAQVRLVAELGNDCTFYFAASAAAYASGTVIDPETNRPLDPMVQPISLVGPLPITTRATVIDPISGPPGDVERFGLMPEGAVILRIQTDGTDYDEAILYARQFRCMSQTYRIIRTWFDGDGGVIDRLLVSGELMDGLDPSMFTPPPSTLVEVGIMLTEIYTSTADQVAFPTNYPFVAATTEVYLDGVRMAMGVGLDYVESGQAIVFEDVTYAGQRVMISYERDGT